MPYLPELIAEPVRCVCCGEIIDAGRNGRKFCSDACKNRWHNRRRGPDADRDARRVIHILNNNRNILLHLLQMNVRSLDRLTLQNLGYNLNYFTSLQKVGHRLVYSCLDIAYELTPTRMKNICHLRMRVDKNLSDEDY